MDFAAAAARRTPLKFNRFRAAGRVGVLSCLLAQARSSLGKIRERCFVSMPEPGDNGSKLLFAFNQPHPSKASSFQEEWSSTYDAKREYGRIFGEGLGRKWRLYDNGAACEASPTYPRYFVLPNEKLFSDKDVKAVLKYRSKGRMPAVVWAHPRHKPQVVIVRSAQPRAGISGPSVACD